MGFQVSGGQRSAPDPLGYDDDVLAQSKTLDEDNLGVDPLAGGMDPAEDWSAANRYGTTAIEQATARPLDERLDEERPDTSIRPAPDLPVAVTPVEELDESIDDELTPGEPVSEPGQVLVGDGVNNTGKFTQEVEMTAAGEHSAMADITQLIMDDHETFRREFAALDDADEPKQLRAIWEPLAALLDLHAAAEEAIFYPQLLRRGDDAEAETVDAIGDHNDIRDGVREAAGHPIGSSPWWDAVHKTRAANSDHMAEEEDDALADFRRNAPLSVRVDLGHQFLKFKTDHSDARDLDTSDKDPQGYVGAVQAQIAPDHSAHHLES